MFSQTGGILKGGSGLCAHDRGTHRESRAPRGARREMAKKNSSFSIARSAKAFQENVNRAGPAAGASYTLIGAILVLGGIGYAIDRWKGTAPFGVAIGLFLGMAVGFYELIKSSWRR